MARQYSHRSGDRVYRANAGAIQLRVRYLGEYKNTHGTPEHREAKALVYRYINRYLRRFAVTRFISRKEHERDALTVGSTACVSCGRPLGGLAGTFEWVDKTIGEGRCGECGWPAKAYHQVTNDDGHVLYQFALPLSYHPEYVIKEG